MSVAPRTLLLLNVLVLVLVQLCAFVHPQSPYDWGPLDYEIFDLHDELSALMPDASVGSGKVSFYAALQLEDTTASLAEITRAYRKASIQYHPDKNSDPNAQKLFTLLTSISTILKDESKRAVYDGHLSRGIPKWRGTGYYYSRFKPSVPFVCFFLAGFVSVVEFVAAWLTFYSKKYRTYEQEDAFLSLTSTQLMKHLKKAGVDSPQLSRKNLKPVDAIKMLRKAGYFKSMQATAAESDAPTSPVKPSFMDMTMVRLPIFLVFSLPLNLYNIFSKATATRKLKADEDLASGVDYSDRDSGRSTPKKKRKHVPRSSSNLHIAAHQQGGVEMNRTASSASSNSSTMSEINSKTNDPFGAEFSAKLSKMVAADSSAEQEGGPQLKSGEWTVDEVVLLAQLMKKYPAAVPGRWVKIATALKREVDDTADKAKEVMENPLLSKPLMI